MKFKLRIFILTIFVLLLSASTVLALSVDEIMDKMEETAPDFTNQKSTSQMILVDKDGKEEIRDMIMFSQEGEDERTSTLMRFLSPKSVKGITLLNVNDGEKMYLYMPAYNKPRRIAGSSKSDEFMGTGLSYEDMSMDYKDKDYGKNLLEETDKEYIVEVLPTEEDVSYEKIILHIDKEKFYAKKVEFYEADGELTKTLTIDKIKIEDTGEVTPLEIAFTDMVENRVTKIIIEEIEYDIELPSDFFSIRTLKKPTL